VIAETSVATIGQYADFMLQWSRDLVDRGNEMFPMSRMAASALQWGRALMSTEIWPSASKGYASISSLQWGHELVIAEKLLTRFSAMRIKCFNGAAIWRPRKLQLVLREELVVKVSSMGPRSSGRGNSPACRPRARITASFNGAAC